MKGLLKQLSRPFFVVWFTRKILNHTMTRRKLYKKNSEPCDEVS
jgi:hypothetical protein